ncbi:Alpha/Beta hydrolase protein [Rhodocollybia butyracea]|uniref:Alpha/Beta hydrolase protein n=1 Tax=Rhodocollybia butyracea TaxID=206335 RepID=A0A9P5P3N0_9AGAR|nr:Alpha/Beta hydrolase protein [Rhodocollybia butyracea]
MLSIALSVRKTQLARLNYCAFSPITTRRNYTQKFSIKPVELDYAEVIPPDGNRTHGALVLVHGMLGFKRNWNSLSKAFSRALNCPVYAVDMRNHGTSPHARPMDYSHMAADVLQFIQKLGLSEISLLGHSMGGKAVMTLALDADLPSDLLKNVIVADIAPVKGRVSKATIAYLDAMKRIEELKLSGSTARKEADGVLTEVEKDPATRAFLLSTLITPSLDSKYARFRVPLDILRDSIPDIGSFPYDPGEATYEGRTLLVKGGRGRFVNDTNIPIFQGFFPNSRLEILDTGHWVHAERPNEFRDVVLDFIRPADTV